MSELIGHFHPVLVHLPIGILLLACLFQWLSAKGKYVSLQLATGISLFIGMLGAIASCVSGYLLSGSGDYDEQLVSRHQWLGISVAVVAVVFYLLHYKKMLAKLQWWLAALLFLLIIITGHLGGSLTHGEDYLTQPFKKTDTGKTGTAVRKPIPNVQEAVVYTDIIQPLLQSKCYNCHGAAKQKGKLRMDQPDLLMKGGKDGVVIEAGKASESELIKRIQLAREEEHHMPPKEKPQLTDKEMALLHWWIASGASFDKKTKDLDQPDKIKPVLLSLQKAVIERKPNMDVPVDPVDKAGEAGIKKLKDKGVELMPVAAGSNYLLANFVTATGVTDKDMDLLLPVKKQLVWLKLSDSKISDAALPVIAQCTNLRRLQLDNTAVTDKGLASLVALKQLVSVNLVGTKITAAGLLQLKELKQLQSIYLYQTRIEKKDWENLKKTFSKTQLDSGGYQVPLFETDTMLVKPPKIQPAVKN
jgi:uncharacterized membrane protein/mono/diheme cytochrome c family protein